MCRRFFRKTSMISLEEHFDIFDIFECACRKPENYWADSFKE